MCVFMLGMGMGTNEYNFEIHQRVSLMIDYTMTQDTKDTTPPGGQVRKHVKRAMLVSRD
jgi:hypothetical protein